MLSLRPAVLAAGRRYASPSISVIFPFRSTFAIKYLQEAQGLSLEQAGTLNSYVFLAAVFVTPIFGLLLDRIGRNALLLIVGSLFLPPSFLVLAQVSDGAGLSTALLGLSFALVPAVLWPSVPKYAPPEHLGTAYGLMTTLQNFGLFGANLAAGCINDVNAASAGQSWRLQPDAVVLRAAQLHRFRVHAGAVGEWLAGPAAAGRRKTEHTRPRSGVPRRIRAGWLESIAMQWLTPLFIVAVLAATATELWLSQRQLAEVERHRDKVPGPFAAGRLRGRAHQGCRLHRRQGAPGAASARSSTPPSRSA